MPINKNGKQYFTDEQYAKARYESNALEYAHSRGYPLVGHGKYYHMEGHDSMIFTTDGRWFWNSQGVSGGALEFMLYYEKLSLTQAVLALTEGQALTQDFQRHPGKQPEQTPSQSAQAEKPAFELPPRSNNYRRLFGYLCTERGIAGSVVKKMIAQGRLYESVKIVNGGYSGYEVHNACFVSYTPEGKPCGAFQRSLSDSGKVYKLDVKGSDKSYGWQLKGTPGSVVVFEAAIDAASYATLCVQQGQPYGDLLSLGGLQEAPLLNYLDAHPDTKMVLLALDMDKAGRRATQQFLAMLQERRLPAYDISQDSIHGKDWNEELLWQRQQKQLQGRSKPSPML